MEIADARGGFLSAGLPEPVVDELLASYLEAKRRYHLGDHRPQAVEGGRFSEATFRILEHATTGKHTPLGGTLPKVPVLLQQLEQAPKNSVLDDSLRLHIPRTLRVIYDIRNQRDAAHLTDNIDPNLQDATLVIANMDWVMAELVRIYHEDVTADEAQAIIEDLVTREVPAIQEIGGQPVLLKDLQPRDQALLLLYREGTDRGATLDEMAAWLRVDRKGNLKARLRRLDEQRLVLEHPDTGRYHITILGSREVEQRRLAQPVEE